MADAVIQPTRKWIRFQYTTVVIVFCVAVFLYVNYFQTLTAWLLVIPGLLFLIPATGSIRRRFTKITITGDKLRYEFGLLSKTTRTIQISKIQDVTVQQSLWQRIFDIGLLSIETAGETSRLTIQNIDSPRFVAEEILDAAQGHPPKAKGERG